MIGVLALGIFQAYLVATTGKSLGKGWLNIPIVKVDGSPVGFVHGVLLRSWLVAIINNIPGIGGIFGLINILMIFGEERRCLHDYIASSKVVAVPIDG